MQKFGYYYSEKNEYSLFFKSVYSNQTKWLLAYGLVLFIIPFAPIHQLIIGTLVNALLIKSAIKFKSKKVFLLSFVPSIAAFSAGFLFGSLTHQVLLMLPFIWAGNLVLMFFIRKYFVEKKKEFFYTNLVAGTIKTALLFAAAIALFTVGLAPAIALTAFGILQFVTAQLGGIVVFAGSYASKKIRTKN